MRMAATETTETSIQVVSMNLGGRFMGRQIRHYGHQTLQNILLEYDVGILFGHQGSFKPRLPTNYRHMGNNKAFIAYDKTRFWAKRDKDLKLYIRDLQFRGKLPQYYLVISNYAICKLKCKKPPYAEFIAISWITDECDGKLKARNSYKKLTKFASDISGIEELPVVIGGTFRVSEEEAEDGTPPDMSCHSYVASTARRAIRQSDFLVSSEDLQITDVEPLLLADMGLEDESEMWRNPEDVFYCDPVMATLHVAPKENSDRELDMLDEDEALDAEEQDGDDEEDKVENSVANGPKKSQSPNAAKASDIYDETSVSSASTCYMS